MSSKPNASDPLKGISTKESHTLALTSFWLALLLPFALDLVLRGQLLTSVVGAGLWVLLITLSAWKPKTRDSQLKKLISKAQVMFWTFFIVTWLYLSLKGSGNSSEVVNWIHPLSTTWLFRIHAFLLAGASGLVFLFGLSSWATQLQFYNLRSDSWQRRRLKGFWKQFPSLESLLKMSSRAVFWAFTCWGVGFALAFLTLFTAYTVGHKTTHLTYTELATDPKIIFTGILWMILLMAYLVQNRLHWDSQKRALWLSSLALVFWTLLSFQAFLMTPSTFHEPVRWFLK